MKRILVNCLLSIVLVFSLSIKIVGATESGAHGGLSFEVIHPASQRDSNVGYFDLKLAPGQKETATIRLHNSSEKEIVVAVRLNGAKTNSSGVIEYSMSDIPNDYSLKIPFERVVTAPQSITIPSQSSYLLPIEVDMPQEELKGLISGAIEIEEQDQVPLSDGAIVNKFAYIIGMTLSQEEDSTIQPDISFNHVEAGQNNFQNAMIINFSNVQPVYFEDMTVRAQIVKENGQDILYESTKNNMRMAPNSMINYPVLLNGDKMKPGKYEAHVVVYSKEGKEWAWTEPFMINKDEADRFNKSDLTLIQEDSFHWNRIVLMMSLASLTGLIIFGIVVVLKRKK